MGFSDASKIIAMMWAAMGQDVKKVSIFGSVYLATVSILGYSQLLGYKMFYVATENITNFRFRGKKSLFVNLLSSLSVTMMNMRS